MFPISALIYHSFVIYPPTGKILPLLSNRRKLQGAPHRSKTRFGDPGNIPKPMPQKNGKKNPSGTKKGAPQREMREKLKPELARKKP